MPELDKKKLAHTTIQNNSTILDLYNKLELFEKSILWD